MARIQARQLAAAVCAAIFIAIASSASAQTVSFPRTSYTSALGATPTKVLALRDGRVLLLSSSKIEVFDPVADAVAASTSTAIFLPGAAAALLADGRVLVTGGTSGGAAQKTATLVNVGTSTITLTATGTMINAHSGHVAIATPDDRVLIYGGGNSESYSGSAGTFASVSGGSTASAAIGTLTQTGSVVLVAGSSLTVATLSGTIFSVVGSVTLPASGWAFATPLADGTALLVGGTATEIVTTTGTITATPGPAVSSRGAGAHGELMGDGSVIIAGGGIGTVERWATDGVTTIDSFPSTTSAGASLFDGSAFVCCDATPTPSRYSPSGGASSFAAVAPGRRLTRTDAIAASFGDGRIAVFSSAASIDVFDPASGLAATATTASTRANAAAVTLADGRILVAGGSTPASWLVSPAASSSLVTIANGPALLARRFRPSLERLASGRVLIGGGLPTSTTLEVPRDGSGTPVTSLELYDPAANTITAVPAYTSGRYGMTMTSMPDGSVYLIGGYDGTGASRVIEKYDPVANAVTLVGALVSGRYWHTATAIDLTHILVAGGLGEEGPGNVGVINKIESIDITTGISTRLTVNLGRSRFGHAALLQSNGTLLFAGGQGGAAVFEPEVYDPVAGTVTVLAPIDAAWEASANRATVLRATTGTTVLVTDSASLAPGEDLFVLRNNVVAAQELATRYLDVAANIANSAQALSDTVRSWLEAYGNDRGNDNTRQHIVPVPGAMGSVRQQASAVRLADGRVLVSGGIDDLGNTLATAEIFNPATGLFTPTAGAMTAARSQHVSLLMPDGRVIVASTTTDVFDPVTGLFTAVTGATFSNVAVGTALVPLSGGRTYFMRSGSGGVFDSVTMRVIPTTLPLSTTTSAAALQGNGDILVLPSTQPAFGFTNTIFRVKDFAGLTATINHAGGYATGVTSIVIKGLAPSANIGRFSIVYLPGRATTQTVNAATTADASGNATIAISALSAAVTDGMALRIVPDVSGVIASAPAGATSITISGLSTDVTIKAGQAFLVGTLSTSQAAYSLVAAADAAADATGTMTVTLASGLPATLMAVTVRLDVAIDAAPGGYRANFTGIDAGSGRIAIVGGSLLDNSTVGSAGADTSVGVYDPATKALTSLPQFLTYTQSTTNPLVRLLDGRILDVDQDVEVIDPTAGTVAVDAVMPSRRAAPTATVLTDGRVLIAGGTPATWSTAKTAYLYSPAGTSYNELSANVTSLTQQLASAQAQIAALSGQVTSLQAQVASLQAQADTIPGLQQTIADLQTQLASAQLQLQQAQSNLTSLQAQLDAANAQNTQLQSSNSTLTAQVASLQQQLAAAEQSLQDTQTQLQQTQASLAAANQGIADRDATIATLNSTLATLIAQKQQLEQDNAALQGQVAALTADKAALQTQVSSLTAQVTSLTSDKAALLAQVASLQAQVSSLTSANAALLAQVVDLTNANATLQAQVTSLTVQNASLQSQVTTLTSTNEALTAQVKSLTSDNAALAAQVKSLTADNAQLRKANEQLTDRNDRLQSRVDDLEKTNRLLGKQVADLSSDNRRLTRENDALRRRISDLEGANQLLDQTVAKLTADNKALTKANNDLTAQIGQLQDTFTAAGKAIAIVEQVLTSLPGGGGVPGSTLSAELLNLANAIKAMPQGSQIQLAKALSGKK
jgi:cell division protein FtsB